MTSPFFGEFMGTLVLILLGDGVVADVLLKRSKAEGAGWMVITAGWCFAVMAGVYTAIACGSRDAYINPAVTLGFAISSGDYHKIVPYVTAQMLGAFVGAVLVWLHFLPHWAATTNPILKLGCFCSHPSIPNKVTNLISEIIPTTLLVFVAVCILTRANLPAGFGPVLIAALVWGLILALAGPTGTSMNPARDLGSRMAHAILPIAGK